MFVRVPSVSHVDMNDASPQPKAECRQRKAKAHTPTYAQQTTSSREFGNVYVQLS